VDHAFHEVIMDDIKIYLTAGVLLLLAFGMGLQQLSSMVSPLRAKSAWKINRFTMKAFTTTLSLAFRAGRWSVSGRRSRGRRIRALPPGPGVRLKVKR